LTLEQEEASNAAAALKDKDSLISDLQSRFELSAVPFMFIHVRLTAALTDSAQMTKAIQTASIQNDKLKGLPAGIAAAQLNLPRAAQRHPAKPRG
jgi:hypothetical protein